MAPMTVHVHYTAECAYVEIVSATGNVIVVDLDDLAIAMPLLLAIAETRYAARSLRDA